MFVFRFENVIFGARSLESTFLWRASNGHGTGLSYSRLLLLSTADTFNLNAMIHSCLSASKIKAQTLSCIVTMATSMLVGSLVGEVTLPHV